MNIEVVFVLYLDEDNKQIQRTVDKIKKFIGTLNSDERYAFRQWLYMSGVFPFDTAILDSWFNDEFADRGD